MSEEREINQLLHDIGEAILFARSGIASEAKSKDELDAQMQRLASLASELQIALEALSIMPEPEALALIRRLPRLGKMIAKYADA